MLCPSCERDFPARLLTTLETGDGSGNVQTRTICPLCARRWVNLAHGLPPDEPFRGESARRLHAEAEEYLRGTGQ